MKRRSLLWRVIVSVSVPLLVACGGVVLEGRPTVQPVINVTRVPTQDVPGTQTAYALQIIPTPTPIGLYVVKAGDTLSKIADAFETTVDEIIAQNGLTDPNQIKVGQQLIIPSLLTPTVEATESIENPAENPSATP